VFPCAADGRPSRGQFMASLKVRAAMPTTWPTRLRYPGPPFFITPARPPGQGETYRPASWVRAGPHWPRAQLFHATNKEPPTATGSTVLPARRHARNDNKGYWEPRPPPPWAMSRSRCTPPTWEVDLANGQHWGARSTPELQDHWTARPRTESPQQIHLVTTADPCVSGDDKTAVG